MTRSLAPDVERIKDRNIYESRNYDEFKFLEYNRPVAEAHVQKLVESFSAETDYHLFPILVTASKEIINGQHRFLAMKRLGIPINYVIDYNFTPDKLIKTNTLHLDWTQTDSLNYYMNLGYEEYLQLYRFMEKHGLKFKEFVGLVKGRAAADFAKEFRRGEFRFVLDEVDYKIIEAHTSIKRFYMDRGYKREDYFRPAPYLKAVRNFFRCDLVEMKRFLWRLEEKPVNFVRFADYIDNVKQFLEIYNYRIKGKILKMAHTKREVSLYY